MVALVGALGAVSTGSSGAAVTPAFGAGQARTQGNLLVCWVATTNTATLPATPAGWTVLAQKAGTQTTATIFGKPAAGGDAAPTIAAITSTVINAQLGEFSGALSAGYIDQSGSGAATSSPIVATAGAADLLAAELVLYCGVQVFSLAATSTISAALNNGASAHDTNNGGTASKSHYDFGYGIPASNSAADAYTFSFSGTTAGAAAALVSVKRAASLLMLAGVGR